jgi:chorismate lyase/3-hydroxybenzoate synthase
MDSPPDDALGCVCFGPGLAAAGSCVSIGNPRLVPGPAAEVWPACGPVERFERSGVQLAADGHALFAKLTFAARGDAGLDAATRDAYARLLSAVRDAGYPHLVRIWNFVPGINEEDDGMERYKLFCKGRSEAFHAHAGEGFASSLPAASAVGGDGDVVSVHALAARRPGRSIENPRQVSAYRYPVQYGPKSPTFARGIVAPAPWDGAVFVSGTASIAGHESLHADDPAAQIRETFVNIAAVLDASGLPGAGRPLAERLHALRVYVRHPSHLPVLVGAVEEAVGPEISVVWLQADICRRELLVEIEATVLAPRR